ncbi:hypothetical protein B7Y92_00425 [Candidatus Saccharibacteria bacterium 32-50-13]|nr:MAG: hypothetical protein B7Y92_00425 [Candidatus Saccharibacteria bacterium 32-50-13]
MYKHVKRFFDTILAFVGLILLSPLFLALAIIIKLESRGPVFFRQLRIGKDEKNFYMYKFRTMKVDAPQLPPNKFNGVMNYITKSGKFLRKSSIDELPQLINIFNGSMSFVGPRPGAAKNEEELRVARRKLNVFSVRPGITGWAQVNGRDELAHNVMEKSKHDGIYVENLSLKLDLLCVLKTLHVVSTLDGYKEGVEDG